MKARILTAAVAIPIMLVMILWAPLWVDGIMVGLLCAVAAVELMRCAVEKLDWTVAVSPVLIAFIMPFWLSVRGEGASLYTLGYWLFFALFLKLILSFRKEERVDLGLILAGLTAGMVMPELLSALIRIGLRPDGGRENMLLPFVIAFSCDSGAFFVGCFLGKHKMAPHLSPNKTIEGGVGGVAAGIAGALIFGAIMSAFQYEVIFQRLFWYGLLGSIFCELGDLAFSAVKRITGIKDFGTIIPGHGGVLDRFDSMYFTAPLLEILTFWFPAVIGK